MGHGRALIGVKDKEKIMPVANKIRNEKLNVRQAEKLINELNDQAPKKKQAMPKKIFSWRNRSLCCVTDLVQQFLSIKGNVKGR